MAVKKPKLDPKTDIPEKKGDIDKVFIVEYTMLHGTEKQRAEIKKCIHENTVERTSQLTKKPYKDIKLQVVRDKFCEMFFPQLVKKPNGKKTFFDLVDEL